MMKKIILIIAATLALAGCGKKAAVVVDGIPPKAPRDLERLPSSTAFAGIISSDTTFSGEVRIEKDIYVSKGVTLTIEPGTTLIIKHSESTKIDPFFLSSDTEILVAGSIIAKGTADKKIKLIAEKSGGKMKDYAGIFLLKSAKAEFEHCEFKGAETAITVIKTEVKVTDSLFERCFYALSATNGFVKSTNNSVVDCDKGFYFHRGSTGEVMKSEFKGMKEDAIFIDKSSKVNVKESVFSDNLWGISTANDRLAYLKDNDFKNNKEDVRGLNYD